MGGSERDIAARASGLSGAARSAYLDEACGGDAGLRARVEALLAAGLDEATATDAGVSPDAATGSAAIPAEHLGDGVIGNYRLLQVIGEGGFGVVYEAEQTRPVHRRVALKLLKPGMDSRSVLARFEAERQALADMDHPCVAKVLDAGETERGLPYFVMELVRGSPITEYCDRQRLTIGQRLELFARVCDAVQHAHTKAIIHRDIKPTNVLVEANDDGPVPKVIDFGIAKAMAQKLTEKTLFTERGQIIGTPEYMSPEQAEMSGEDIDTRSDVYSLGVLLYELLTGERPFDLKKAAFIEIQRVIREVEPPKPSTRLTGLGETGTKIAGCRRTDLKSLSGTLRRELEWIPLKALRKDRTERYGTAADLGEDVRRYVAGEALEAGPPSAGYRLRKFVRRNRGPVAAVVAICTVLVVGIVGTSYGFAWAVAERQRADNETLRANDSAKTARAAEQRARTEASHLAIAESQLKEQAQDLETVVNFQTELIASFVPEVMGSRVHSYISDSLINNHARHVSEYLDQVNFTTIASQLLDEELISPAIEAADRQFDQQPLVRATVLDSLGRSAESLGLFAVARRPLTVALDLRGAELGSSHELTISSMRVLALLFRATGEYDKAEALAREALKYSRSQDAGYEALASAMCLGLILMEKGELDEALDLHYEAPDGYRRDLGAAAPETLTCMANMTTLFFSRGEYALAERFAREAAAGREQTLGPDHPSTLRSISVMAVVLGSQSWFAEAAPLYARALNGQRRVLEDDHPETLTSLHNWGHYLLKFARKPDHASIAFRDAYEARSRVLGSEHPRTLTSAHYLAETLLGLRRYKDAKMYAIIAVDGFRNHFGDEDSRTISAVAILQQIENAATQLPPVP